MPTSSHRMHDKAGNGNWDNVQGNEQALSTWQKKMGET